MPYPPCPICQLECHPAMARRYKGCCNDQCEEIQDLRAIAKAGEEMAKAIRGFKAGMDRTVMWKALSAFEAANKGDGDA